MARPPKNRKRANDDGEAITPAAMDALFGQENDKALTWNVSRSDIQKAAQTVSGIADLAKVSRRTVLRNGVPCNTCKALQFIRDARRSLWRPVVSSSNPMDWRNLTSEYITIWQIIIGIRYARTEVVFDPTLSPVQRNWKRKKKIHAARPITDTERKLFKKCRVWHYDQTPGKVTVRMLCATRSISRVSFYKWLGSVPLKYQKRLRGFMVGPIQDEAPIVAGSFAVNSDGFFADREPEILMNDR